MKLFDAPTHYDSLPKTYRVAIGVYSGCPSGDRDPSVAVVLAESCGKYYVLDVVRRGRRDALVEKFAAELISLRDTWRGSKMLAFASVFDVASYAVFVQSGLPLDILTLTGDRFVRAQPSSAAWNRGNILVPRNAEWIYPFITEVCAFTGLDDGHSAQVQALAAAHAALRHADKEPQPRSAYAAEADRLRDLLIKDIILSQQHGDWSGVIDDDVAAGMVDNAKCLADAMIRLLPGISP